MSAKQLKGEYDLNPTTMIMKQGSEGARAERQPPGPRRVGQLGLRAGDSSADRATAGCTECADMTHPAMQTRHSHPANLRHADGRLHEDQHHAVKMMKGKY